MIVASRRPLVVMLVWAILLGPRVLASQEGQVESGCTDPIPMEVVFTSASGAVTFPHLLHQEMEIPCEDCHHETLAAQLTMPHPDYFEDFWIQCATCHRTSSRPACPQRCSDCHHSSPSTVADETLGTKVVIHQACWECHPIGAGSEASENCSFCHLSDSRGGVG